MKFHHLQAASRFLTPARPFDSARDEKAFQSDYLSGGYGFAVAVMIVGAVMALSFMTIAALDPIDGTNSFELQLLRGVIGIGCAMSFLALTFAPEWSLENHFLTVFTPSFIALGGLGLLLFLPRPEAASAVAFGRSTLSLIIAIWLISAFCRLPLKQVMAMSVAASLLNLVGLKHLSVTHLPFFATDLLIANFTVWALTIQIEKRERLLWFQTSRAQRAQARAERNASRATVLNQVQTRLMQSIGHDIRQPLSSSGIYLGLVSSAAAKAENQNIANNAERLGGCLRAVESTLNRLIDGQVETDAEHDLLTDRTTLTNVFQDLRHIFEPQAKNLGIQLRFTGACNVAHPVRSNDSALLEILGNLISNAIKYSSIHPNRTGVVVVGVVSVGSAVRIDVIDNGIGIDASLHSRVFEEQFRVPAVTDIVPGAGLGLSIVESMVQRLPEHRLRLCSSPRTGTRIRLYLPCA